MMSESVWLQIFDMKTAISQVNDLLKWSDLWSRSIISKWSFEDNDLDHFIYLDLLSRSFEKWSFFQLWFVGLSCEARNDLSYPTLHEAKLHSIQRQSWDTSISPSTVRYTNSTLQTVLKVLLKCLLILQNNWQTLWQC